MKVNLLPFCSKIELFDSRSVSKKAGFFPAFLLNNFQLIAHKRLEGEHRPDKVLVLLYRYGHTRSYGNAILLLYHV